MLSSTTLVVCLSFRSASAQTQEYAFGEFRSFQIPTKFESATLVQWNAKASPIILLWSDNYDTIVFSKFNNNLDSVNYYTKQIFEKYDDVYSADVNRDGSNDLILLSKTEKKISIVTNTTSEVLKIYFSIKLEYEPEKIVICDYNNDYSLDLLIYSRKVPGIIPLINNGNGQFRMGNTIAPDNSIGALEPVLINNDNIIDLFLFDWIKSELHVLYGVGKGRFIDQSVFPVKGDVEEIKAVYFGRFKRIDLLLKMSNKMDFQVWHGNYFGDFQLTNTISTKANVIDYDVRDINNDKLNDLIILTSLNFIKVVFNDYIEPFSNRITYAVEDFSYKMFFSEDVENKNCIVLNNKKSKYIVLRTSLEMSSISDSVTLVTGINPTEILTEDFNGDKINDFAVLCTKSQAVFFYFGRQKMIPLGPFSQSLTVEPKYFTFHSKLDSTIRFVISYPITNQISYLSMDTANNYISNAFIGSEGSSEILSTSTTSNNLAEFITFNRTVLEGNSLSYFEQINPSAFIERTFRLSHNNSFLGASVVDLNSDNFPDIVYAYDYRDTSLVELGVAFGDSNFVLKNRIILKELALPNVKRVFMFSVDFDKDGILDLIMYAGSPIENLLIAKGIGEGRYDDPKVLSSGTLVEERSNIKIVDVDRDGFADIVIGSQKNKQIIWFRNLGDFLFDVGKVLAFQPDFSNYVIADIDGDNINDLALTFAKLGMVKIINGKQLQYGSK